MTHDHFDLSTLQFDLKRVAVKVKPAALRKIKQRHPWIFESSILKINKEANAGDLCVIFDQKSNQFLACGLFDPFSPIRIKLLQYDTPKTINDEWFEEKIALAFEKRKPLLQTDTNSYRLIYGENDGLPGFIADVYDQVLVIKLYSFSWVPYLSTLLELLIKYANTETAILRLSRNVQKVMDQNQLKDGMVIHGTLENEEVLFKEYGITFSANVIKGHKTGFFLDQRHNRKKISQLAKGKTVLDVFSYAGGFAIHALIGGAQKVSCIDVSQGAHDIALKNASLNSFEGDMNLITADAFVALKTLRYEGEVFDIVIIDPPSFAKSESEIDAAIWKYKELTKLGAVLTKKNGVLVLASCSSRVQSEVFFSVHEKVFRELNISFEILERTYHDIDHPVSFQEGSYLKCSYYRKLE